MRVQRRARIVQPNTRTGSGGDLGQSTGTALQALGEQITDTAFSALGKQRLADAKVAAETLDFQRDEQGRIKPPKLPGANHLLGPSLYERAYQENVLDRYQKQVALDANKRLSEIARNHPRDPDGFEEVSNAYLASIRETVAPEVAASVDLQLQGMQTTLYNGVADAKAQWVHENNTAVHVETMTRATEELYDLVAAGTNGDLIASQVSALSALADDGVRRAYLKADAIPGTATTISEVIARGTLARSVTQFPNTDLGNAQMLEQLNKFVAGEGTIKQLRNGKLVDVSVAEVFPSAVQRKQITAPTEAFLKDVIATRNSLQKYEFERAITRYNAESMAEVRAAQVEGRPMDAVTREETERLIGYAIDSGNVSMIQHFSQFIDIDDQTLETQADLLNDIPVLHAKMNSLNLDDEAIAMIDKLMTDEVPLAEFLAGRWKGGATVSLSEAVTRLKSILSLFDGGGSPSKARLRYNNEEVLQAQKAAKAQNDYYASIGQVPGSDLTDEQARELNFRLSEAVGIKAWEQTEANARELDSIYTERGLYPEGMTSAQVWGSWPQAQRLAFIHSELKRDGIIPEGLLIFLHQELADAERINRPGMLGEVLDIYRAIEESPKLLSSLQTADGALAEAMEFHEDTQPGRVPGQTFFENLRKLETGQDLREPLDDARAQETYKVIDELMARSEFGDPISFFSGKNWNFRNNVGRIPRELMPDFKHYVWNEIDRFSTSDPDRIEKKINAMAETFVLERGYIPSRFGFSGEAVGGIVYEGASILPSFDRPDESYGYLPPELFYTDEYGQPDEAKLNRIKERADEFLAGYKGKTIGGVTYGELELGKNVLLRYNEGASRELGQVMWTPVVIDSSGQALVLPDPRMPEHSAHWGFDGITASVDDYRMELLKRSNELAAKRRANAQQMYQQIPNNPRML